MARKAVGFPDGINLGNEDLKYYDESIDTSYTLTFTGGASGSQTMSLVRVGRVVVCNLGAKLTSATASGTASGTIPVGFRPHSLVTSAVRGIDNGTNLVDPAMIVIATNGTFTIYKTLTGISFTGGAGGATGIEPTFLSWVCAT
jgi:hypothetical protein